MAKNKRRSDYKRPTKEALYLRKLRIEKDLSIRECARQIGKSTTWLTP